VLGASDNVTTAAGQLTEEVRKFFVALRTGPMDRRNGTGANFQGAERRADRTGDRASRAA
jgi:hypothetical protein